jgi:hypothetical protein
VLGEDELYTVARTALLDALEALGEHAASVVVIGAQAVYPHTGQAALAVAPFTRDADLVLDPRALANEPTLDGAMRAAGFVPDATKGQPGAWLSPSGAPVDLMVPEALAGPPAPGRRGGRIPPHSKRATRRAVGLEAAVVDHDQIEISGLDRDTRRRRANVAGPAALLVAKLHKLGERRENPGRLAPKDAHDVYRLLAATETEEVARRLEVLLRTEVAAAATTQAMVYLAELFAAGPTALGSALAGRAEVGVGEPATTSQAVSFLAADVIAAV